MIQLPGAIAALGGILVLAAAIGALIAGIRTGILRSTITDQGAAITALKERAEASERAEAECAKRMDIVEEKLRAQKEVARTLAETVTGATKLTDIVQGQSNLTELEIKHHGEVVARLADIIEAVADR